MLGTIPVMLGFHPEDSLVVVGLSGERRRVGPVARIDLHPDGLTNIAAVGDLLVLHATQAIAIVYGGQGEITDLDIREHLGLEVLDVLRVTNTPYQVHAPVAELYALGGRAVLRDRVAVRASVEHHDGTSTAATRCTISELATTTGRDQFIIERITDASAAVAELVAAAQAAADRDPGADNVCGALAILAYRSGDGALAQVAVDRALRINPDHQLARVAIMIMAAGLNPEAVEQFVTA